MMLSSSRLRACLASLFGGLAPLAAQSFELAEGGYFNNAAGTDVLVFNSAYGGLFSDAKISGIELIHFGERIATNGDVRLHRTPEQWDAIPALQARRVLPDEGAIEADLAYASHDFHYTLRVEAASDGTVEIAIRLDRPVPAALVGRAALHLEFLPSAYWGKAFLLDEATGRFPHYPASAMERVGEKLEPKPLATGRHLVLAPEDDHARIGIELLEGAQLALYDGRNVAQNGWYTVQTSLPGGQTGEVVRWRLRPAVDPDWRRPPMIAHSQVGYPASPDAPRLATIELDARDEPGTARLLRLSPDGSRSEVLSRQLERWGAYHRYHYAHFDFSEVTAPGLYQIEYEGQRTSAFPIGEEVYADTWQPTLDIFFPVQMDHMHVNEAYRVWHGASHLDDARQAPVDHEHFDLYAQGPTTDSPYQPGEHIPGLNIGGWYDAGDYDIRTQTQCYVIRHLVATWDLFRPERDQTFVDQANRYVDIHHPDGKPDLLQQIEHGALALLAQHRAVGHAIPGIVSATLLEYTHLGDGSTKTDNLIYDPSMGEHEADGYRSGKPDDRWAFTSRTTPLNYASAAALAAASRALRGYDEALAEECLETALGVWQEEQAKEQPDLFRHGNTTGGDLEDELIRAAAELYLTTGERRFLQTVEANWPRIDEYFVRHAAHAVRLMPDASEDFRQRLEARTRRHLAERDEPGELPPNPFGVTITEGGWAGSGLVVAEGVAHYFLHRAFPEIVPVAEVYRSLYYIHGHHPDHNLSLVSGVGARSQMVAYGTNRADFSYIAGGVVPGVLILPPGYPENKTDWPFFWGQNEYVVSVGASYLFLARAAHALSAD
ncbi:MAG: glycoside hydrolase family 9 protein [Verrucomicrobiota bacterium]